MTQTRILAGLIESHHALHRSQGRLRALQFRYEEAAGYRAKPGSNPHLGLVQQERIRAQYAAAIADLRAARRQAHRLLGISGPGF